MTRRHFYLSFIYYSKTNDIFQVPSWSQIFVRGVGEVVGWMHTEFSFVYLRHTTWGFFQGKGRVSLVRPWSVTVFNRSYLILVSVSDCNYCENQDRIPYRVIPERPLMFLGCLLWLWDVSWRLWSSANTHRQMIPRWIWLMYYWYFCDNAVKENVWKQFIRMFAYCEVWKK